MEKIIKMIEQEMIPAFEKAGYDAALAKVTVSNRPDLCEYQCNGAMAGAKLYKKAPIMIANDVVANLKDSATFEHVDAVNPGFINLKLSGAFLADYMNGMQEAEALGVEKAVKPPAVQARGKPLNRRRLSWTTAEQM